jgi:SpoVK/Ycf46/Vps4 family AAA+-type ATPase
MKLSTEKTRILRNLQLSPPRGVLLHGPSGSGKTALALSIAHQSGLNVIHVQVPSILRSHQTAGYFDQVKICWRI